MINSEIPRDKTQPNQLQGVPRYFIRTSQPR